MLGITQFHWAHIVTCMRCIFHRTAVTQIVVRCTPVVRSRCCLSPDKTVDTCRLSLTYHYNSLPSSLDYLFHRLCSSLRTAAGCPLETTHNTKDCSGSQNTLQLLSTRSGLVDTSGLIAWRSTCHISSKKFGIWSDNSFRKSYHVCGIIYRNIGISFRYRHTLSCREVEPNVEFYIFRYIGA